MAGSSNDSVKDQDAHSHQLPELPFPSQQAILETLRANVKIIPNSSRQYVKGRSLFLGLFRRGISKVTLTEEGKQIARLLNHVLYNHAPDHHFTSIVVNFCTHSEKHKDVKNTGSSIITALGDFSNGELLIWEDDTSNPQSHDIKGRLLTFDGAQHFHHNTPYQGERWSIIWFTYKAALSFNLESSDLDLLQQLGFNLPKDPRGFEKKGVAGRGEGKWGKRDGTAPQDKMSGKGKAEGKQSSAGAAGAAPQQSSSSAGSSNDHERTMMKAILETQVDDMIDDVISSIDGIMSGPYGPDGDWNAQLKNAMIKFVNLADFAYGVGLMQWYKLHRPDDDFTEREPAHPVNLPSLSMTTMRIDAMNHEGLWIIEHGEFYDMKRLGLVNQPTIKPNKKERLADILFHVNKFRQNFFLRFPEPELSLSMHMHQTHQSWNRRDDLCQETIHKLMEMDTRGKEQDLVPIQIETLNASTKYMQDEGEVEKKDLEE